SGRLSSQIWMASFPLSVEPISSMSGSDWRISSRRLRTVSESSTTRTLVLAIVHHQRPDHAQKLRLIEFAFHDVSIRAYFVAAPDVFGRIARRDENNGRIVEHGVRPDLLNKS